MLSQKISQIILEQQTSLATAILERQYTRQPALRARYGPREHQKALRDVGYHLTYLIEALAVDRPALFADYIAWAGPVLVSYNVPVEVLRVTLESMHAELRGVLDESLHATLQAYFDAGVAQLDVASRPLPSFVLADAPHGDLAQQYLDALIAGDRRQASQLVLEAVKAGVSVKDVYLHVFQPVQYEVGRLWQTNVISVGQEHYATAVTQLVMSQLYPYIFSTARAGHTLVATCVGGELHEIGVRMVADFFEMAGWDTFYLGANTPAESILSTVEERHADVLAISATMTMHVSKVTDLIQAVRHNGTNGVRMMVGGYPFNRVPDLWQQVGADGFAADADTAIEVAGQLAG